MPRRPILESAHIETLEDRTLLSATTLFDAGTGQLTVQGSSSADSITVSANAGFVTLNGVDTGVAVGDVQSLMVLGGSGSDSIDLHEVTPAAFTSLTAVTIDGGNGHDSIVGSAFNDTIFGGNGKDSIDGFDGNDTIYGGNGKDDVHGGEGNDLLVGGNGKDGLFSDANNDVLEGTTAGS
jgi:Ca2+-binding RTX toxin-like protein